MDTKEFLDKVSNEVWMDLFIYGVGGYKIYNKDGEPTVEHIVPGTEEFDRMILQDYSADCVIEDIRINLSKFE